ncbi:MAG: efflux RND transporter periplasmic adaptor subunit [Limnobacter sp.]|nr:efflux RND transporter periplasmic adaptor subunit [Limnobacter sp.]
MPALLLLQACSDSSKAAPAQPPDPLVVVQVLETKDVPLKAELPGRTSAYQMAEVRPQVGGIVLSRKFQEGALVKAGEPLYQIDPARYRAQLESAKAMLAKAQATVASTQARNARFTELVEIEAVSKQERDDAKAAMLQAQAELAAAKAAVDTAQINLDYTLVRSPIAGRIGRSTATTGALVAAGQTEALATVLTLDPIYVDLTQSSLDLLKLKQEFQTGTLTKNQSNGKNTGQPVNLIMENGKPYPQEGRLQFSEVNVDPTTGSVTLRAVFPNPDGLLLPGMYVNAVLSQGTKPNAILVPQKAVTRNGKGEAVALVLNKDNVVEARVLKTDYTLGADWVIGSGVQAGDRVIVEGVQKVKPGVKAQVSTQAAEAADAATQAKSAPNSAPSSAPK